jgi:outer membrane protein assembly factor BamB
MAMPWLCSLCAILVGAAAVVAEDWPQWLGPRRDGSTVEKVVPWKQPPEVLWRKAVGEGHSSPVVAGGKVYLLTKVKDKEAEELTAYNAASGGVLSRQAYARGKFSSPFGTGPQATPAVHDGRVYTFGATAILSCFDAGSGRQLWQVKTLERFHGKNLFFGAACSPLVEGEKVIVNVGAPGASVVAFGTGDGEVVWKALDDPASYSSPIALGEGPRRQVVFLTGNGLVSLRAANGRVVWQFPLKDRLMESSTTPVRAGDRLVASSITYGTVALDLVRQGGKPAVKQAWKNDKLTSYFTTPVTAGEGELYMVTGTNPLSLAKPQATLHCIDPKDGAVRWSHPGVGDYHAALVRTGDGKVLVMEERGSLVLLQPDKSAYRELARSKVCGRAWAHPAIANGRLYVRDEKELVCLRLPR